MAILWKLGNHNSNLGKVLKVTKPFTCKCLSPGSLYSSELSSYRLLNCRFFASDSTKTNDNKYTTTRDTLDLTFNDAKQAYKSKSTWELLRAYLVFQLCSVNYLVENNEKLVQLGQNVLGKRLFGKVMELSFYGHFVAGPDEIKIQPKIKRLNDFGVKAILDYSAEEDLSAEEARKASLESVGQVQQIPKASPANETDEFSRKYKAYEEFADRRKKALAKTYFYMDEAQCERNMGTFLQSIGAVSTSGTGFAAIKITALGRPQLLLHLSEGIGRVRRYVGALTGNKGRVIQQNLKIDALRTRFEQNGKTDEKVKAWLDNLTCDSEGNVLLVVPWQDIINNRKGVNEALTVPDLTTGKMKSLMPEPLSDLEERMARSLMRRLHTIFEFAQNLNVRVMVDAEQTYFQQAISRITMEMMKMYNTERAIVFNTYQCYLNGAYNYLVSDLEQARRQNFYFGAKLVRGAYIEHERERANAVGYTDPTNPTFEATSEMYHRCFEEGMKRMAEFKIAGKPQRIVMMAASHNEDTVRFIIQKMKEHKIKRSDRVVSFGQLYGMCDQITFPLGQSGYSVYKYVPYGPVNEVLPYLGRRARENKGLVAKTDKEKRLLRQELIRRILRGQIFYRPKGNYYVV